MTDNIDNIGIAGRSWNANTIEYHKGSRAFFTKVESIYDIYRGFELLSGDFTDDEQGLRIVVLPANAKQ